MNVKKTYRANHCKVSPLKSLATMVVLSSVVGTASAAIRIGEAVGTEISIFGNLDAGVLYQSKASTDGDKRLSLESGGLRPSVLGFKGTRVLDNGWTAFFNLESHFDLNNGKAHGSGDATGGATDVVWRRQANVGLSGDWGSVTIGRQYGPAILAQLGTEPRAYKENMSGTFPWAFGKLFTTINDENGAGRNANNDVGFFLQNAIQYRGNINGIDFGVLYSLGGQEGSAGDGGIFSTGASYSTGPMTFSGSYEVMKDEQTSEDVVTSWTVGTAYNLNALSFKLQYLNTENNNSTGDEILDLNSIGLGVDWKWSNKNSATIAYYLNEDNAPNESVGTKTLVVSNDYTLSASTILYAQMAFVDSDDMGVVSQYATSVVATPTPVDEKTVVLNVGVNFSF